MNRWEILELPAGPRMDGLLAECFLRYPQCLHGHAKGTFVVHEQQPIWLIGPDLVPMTCPRFSTVPEDSHKLVEALSGKYSLVTFDRGKGWGWRASFKPKNPGFSIKALARGFWAKFRPEWAEGSTVMEAVGRAALLHDKSLRKRPLSEVGYNFNVRAQQQKV